MNKQQRREKRKQKESARQTHHLEKRVDQQNALMLRAGQALEATTKNVELLQQRNDFWRNLMVASAFARGLGNERPIIDVIEECVPQLMGDTSRPWVPGQVPDRKDAQTMAAL